MESLEVREMLMSGKPPVELGIYPICSPVEDAEFAYYVGARVNVPDRERPVLPKNYRGVAKNSVLGAKYEEWTLRKLYSILPALLEQSPHTQFVAFDISSACFKLPGALKAFERLASLPDDIKGKVCLAFPSRSISAGPAKAAERLRKIKELGFMTAIGDYGSKDCLLTALSEPLTDYVFVDPSVVEGAVKPASPYRHVLGFASGTKNKVILPAELPEGALSLMAQNFGCAGYVSFLAERAPVHV